MALKILKINPKNRNIQVAKKTTLNFAFDFMADGTINSFGAEWEAPFVVPEDHPIILDYRARGLIILEDFKPEIETKKKRKETSCQEEER